MVKDKSYEPLRWDPVGPANIKRPARTTRTPLPENHTVGIPSPPPSPGANLEQLTTGGFTLGAAITTALLDGDTTYLMLGSCSSFSGDEVSLSAQYGYDRFQRADLAHETPAATVDAALASEEQAMNAELSAPSEPPSSSGDQTPA